MSPPADAGDAAGSTTDSGDAAGSTTDAGDAAGSTTDSGDAAGSTTDSGDAAGSTTDDGGPSASTGGDTSPAALDAADSDADNNFSSQPPGATSASCPGNLRVIVTDANTGAPLSGAGLDVQGPAGSSGSTNDAGVNEWDGIPCGDYVVKASHAGYGNGTGSGVVTSNNTTNVPIALTPVTVAITPPPCQFVAKGKPRKFKAVGAPSGGTYQWTATGGVSVTSGGATDEVTVTGNAASAAVDDVTLTVTYTQNGGTATDQIKLTAYEITRIDAKLRGTPCRRSGSGADTMPAKSSTSDSKVFDATAVTVVRGCGDLALTATVAPAAVPVTWAVERAPDDAGSLTGLPALSGDGAANKQKVTANAAGSFSVMVFHDCGGKGKPDASDGVIVLNLNIVDMQISQNDVISRNTRFRANRSNAATLVVDSSATAGGVPGVNAAYGDAIFTKYPLSVKVTVTLIGGGADKTRGTDKVRLGYIQTTTSDSITGTYADGRTLKEVIAVNAGLADPITGGTPAMLAFPVRDTRGASNSGSGPFIVSSSDVDKSSPASGGLQRVVRYVEPPAIALDMVHPVTGAALASISGSNNFDFFLSGYSDDFNENYAVAASASWSLTYGSYTAAGGWTSAGAAVTAPASMAVQSPPRRAEDLMVERCPPNFVDNLKMDAR